jgi:hypothetical protein
MPKISVGRSDEDREEYGLKGTGIIGKHMVGENHEAHTANPIYFDLARPHVMGVFGKRGTGKCLLPGQKVLTDIGLVEVDELFEEARINGEAKILKNDEQLYAFEGDKVASVKADYSTAENRIKAGYRKKVDEKLIKLETASGRKITVTQDHPLFTAEGWKNADKLSEEDRIGVPRNIKISFENSELQVPDSFHKAEFSNIKKRESKLLDSDREELKNISDGTGSYNQMVESAKSEGLIELQNGQVLVTEQGQNELEKRVTNQHYRVGKSKPIKVPEKVTPELADFISCMIAEGHEQKINKDNYRLIFTNNNQNLLKRFKNLGEKLFDLRFKKMDQSSIYTNSKSLELFLEENGYPTGKNSFKKEIPNFIISAESKVVRKFLQTYFDCEGNVTNQQIELTTASKQIANAVNYMLLRFGIIGRTTQKQKYAANTKEKKVRKYYQITISDSNQLSKFMHQIGFSISHKSEKLNSIIKDSNTNVDTIKCAEKLRICRESMGADRTQIAEHKQSLKAYEDEKYMPSRDKLREFTEKLGKQLDKLRNLKNKVEKKPSIKAIEGLIDESEILWKDINETLGYSRSDKRFLEYKQYRKNPEKLAEYVLELFETKHDLEKAEDKLGEMNQLVESDIFWDPIEKIEKIDYEGWVYDLTVKRNHSFTAGFGGSLCHNSYSLGTIAEELQTADISDNLSTIIIDPMGIYWSMKRPNDRSAALLENWDIKPDAFDAQVYIPEGKTKEFEEQEMPYDDTFTLNPSRFTAQEWGMAFGLDMNSEMGILLERVISKLQEETDGNYTTDHIIKGIRKFDFPKETQEGLVNRFMAAQDWGVFSQESSLDKFTTRGELSIIDVSAFGEMSSGWSVRALVVALLAKRILRKRMTARRIEEIDEMENIAENEMPIVWMLIDEAHEFLPAKGKTPASDPLLRWVKIGREPGVSLVLATQQPAKLHPNALSQCDVVLSHRLTAKQDIDSLGDIMQTYMRHDIGHYINALPDRTGTGLILDDNSERIYPIQMRPRKSWHAGGTPDAFND